MTICTTGVYSYPEGFIGDMELQRRRAQGSRGNIGEYLHNLLVQQAITGNVGALREEVGPRT